MDPVGPEPTWVTLGRILGGLLFEWGGYAFVFGLLLLFAAKSSLSVKGYPGLEAIEAWLGSACC